jgi:tetratricopeptide (TPR) repeat protein
MIRQFIFLTALAASLMAQTSKLVADAKALNKAGKHNEAITALEGALKTSPKDAAPIKATLAESYLGLGESTMNNEQLRPMQKYPAALRAFRKVLEFDKGNKKATDNIAMIEGIYKQMGRPIPQ